MLYFSIPSRQFCWVRFQNETFNFPQLFVLKIFKSAEKEEEGRERNLPELDSE